MKSSHNSDFKHAQINGWLSAKLGDMCDVRDGTHDSPKFFDRGIPLVTSKNIKEGIVDLTDVKFISETDAIEINKRSSVDKNDILMSMIGSIGDVALVTKEPDFCIKNVALIKEGRLNQDYLRHWLQGPIFQASLKETLDGGIQKFISLGKLRNFEIFFPETKKEQEAIAETLSNADALIDSLENLIAKKSQIFGGLFDQILSEHQNLLSELAPWQSYSLNETHQFLSTATNSRSDLQHNGTGKLYIHYGDIHTKFGMHLDCRREYIPTISPDKKATSSEIQIGDLVMADASEDLAGIGRATEITSLHDTKAVISGLHTYLLRPKLKIFAPRFQGYFFNSDAIKLKYLKVYTGMKVYGVSKAALKQVSFKVPSIESQKKIIEILDPFSQEIECLKLQLLKAKKIKAGMMQELLTGRTRLI